MVGLYIIGGIFLIFLIGVIWDWRYIRSYRKVYAGLKNGDYVIRDIEWEPNIEKWGFVNLCHKNNPNNLRGDILFYSDGDARVSEGIYFINDNVFGGLFRGYYKRKFWKVVRQIVIKKR